MGASLNEIFSFITDDKGTLFYHLVLVFSIAAALQAAFVHWRSSEFPQARRTMFGLGMLLIAQIGLFLVSGLGFQGMSNLSQFLPPLDRAVALFSLVWMIWLWAFPEPSRPADAGTWLLSLLVVAALGLSLVAYSADPTISSGSYNKSTYDTYWQLASVGFALFGLFILSVRRPNSWGYGFAVFLLSFAGHLLYLLIGEAAGDYPGIVRLAHLASYPFLMTLPQRFPGPANRLTSVKQQDAPVGERRKYSTDPKTFHALLGLAGESATDKLSEAITRAIAQTMLADLCFLIYLTDNNTQMQIASGYDLIREENLEGGSMNKTMIPMLTNALQRGRPLRLPASSTSADIKGLSDLLGLANPGHLMSVPIITSDKEPLGGVLLLSPYSNRLWSAEDQAFLTNIAVSLVPIIQRGQKMTSLEVKSEQAKQALDVAQSRVMDLERRNAELLKQMDAVRADAEAGLAQAENIAALRKMQEETQKALEKLKQENEELRHPKKLSKFGSSKQVDKQVESELRMTLEEMAHLQNQLAEANMKIIEAEKGSSATRSSEQAEVVASISQELRQPMSSIVGYTDLLLGESVGILGTLQRKFVERIKSSTERIGSLIDDLIQVTTLETGLHELKPEPVDLDLIIDNAMSYTSSQIREKNISLHLDLPKNVAPIYADREALQQILIHLLQNAGAASPLEGTVHLRVLTKVEDAKEYVLIQVSDTGGGISVEDMGRVFTRLYRADNVLIQGVGDTGVGLSIAKTLTEAQKGRIWVDSKPGIGSTFSVLLPIAKNAPTKTAES